MRFEMLTPHQFENLSPYIDTVFYSSFTPTPFDIAIPQGASASIATMLTLRLNDRFMGRLAHIPLGATFQLTGIHEESLRFVRSLYAHSVRFGVVITDRTIRLPEYHLDIGGVRWLIFDWWQWIRTHVPHERVVDALMYLVHANNEYLHSLEYRQIGMDTKISEGMAKEGKRLIDCLTDWMSQAITDLWETKM